MLRALASGLALFALAGCAPPPPEDIANAFRSAFARFKDPEAAEKAVCRSLERFSSTPATTLSELIQQYYDSQRGYPGDPGASDLADTAGDVNNAQKAAEVAANLGC